MARDYYAETRAICEELQAAGREDLADELRDALQSGSTATEILMDLRWNLKKALTEESDLGGTKEKMRSLKEGLDQVLS